MSISSRVHRDRSLGDSRAFARPVISAAVKHDLIGIDVGVIVGDRYRVRGISDLARHEIAHDEIESFEDAGCRWRLMDPSCGRSAIVNTEREGIRAAGTTDYVERMAGIQEPRADDAGGVSVLDEHLDIAALQFEGARGPMQIAFAVRRIFQ